MQMEPTIYEKRLKELSDKWFSDFLEAKENLDRLEKHVEPEKIKLLAKLCREGKLDKILEDYK